jgi:uncharacterized protein
MMRMFFLFLFFEFSNLINGQEVYTKVVMPSAATDSKPNNDSVPDVYALIGQFRKVIVIRLKYQTDLLEGIKKFITQEKIKNAVILSGIGSVRNYNFHVVSNRIFPVENIFVKNASCSADIAGMNGYIIDGRVHAHITFSNADKAFGGHLEPGTNIFTFAIITIGLLNDSLDLNLVDNLNYR